MSLGSIASIMCSAPNVSTFRYQKPLLDIEENFDNCGYFTEFSNNWKLIYLFIAIYLAAIYLGKEYMKTRPPFQLRGALLLWNVTLATYSFVSAWRTVPTAYYVITTHGMHAASCTAGSLEERKALGIWIYLFIISKIVEFGDTAFIVLRKQKLLFLHWYHHITVAFLVWSCGAYASPMQAFFTIVNVFVHSIMYTYYALKVLRIRVPKPVSMFVTILQLMQMALGVFVTWFMYHVKSIDPTCMVTYRGILLAVCIYVSYFVLFLNFFIRTYVMKKKPVDASSATSKKLM